MQSFAKSKSAICFVNSCGHSTYIHVSLKFIFNVQVPDVHRRPVCIQRDGHSESAGHGVRGGPEGFQCRRTYDTQVVHTYMFYSGSFWEG